MQRGHDGGGSTRSRCYPCAAKCVISPNFKLGCFERVRASHLNVSPDITFIQFASQLRASMVSSHTHPRQPTRGVEIVNSKMLLRRCQILNHFFPQDISYRLLGRTRIFLDSPSRCLSHEWGTVCFFLLNSVEFGPMIIHKQGWLYKLEL